MGSPGSGEEGLFRVEKRWVLAAFPTGLQSPLRSPSEARGYPPEVHAGCAGLGTGNPRVPHRDHGRMASEEGRLRGSNRGRPTVPRGGRDGPCGRSAGPARCGARPRGEAQAPHHQDRAGPRARDEQAAGRVPRDALHRASPDRSQGTCGGRQEGPHSATHGEPRGPLRRRGPRESVLGCHRTSAQGHGPDPQSRTFWGSCPPPRRSRRPTSSARAASSSLTLRRTLSTACSTVLWSRPPK